MSLLEEDLVPETRVLAIASHVCLIDTCILFFSFSLRLVFLNVGSVSC